MTRIGFFGRVGLATIFCGLIALEIFAARRSAATASATGSNVTGAPASGDIAGSATPSWVADVLARPLFSPSRAPAAIDTAGAVGAPRLSGIIVTTAGDSAVFTLASGKSVLLQTGGAVGNLIVRGISAAGVTVIGPDGLRILHTQFAATGPGDNGSGDVAATPPPAPFAALATASPMPDWMQQGPPDLPSAATWSGVPQLSHLPAVQPQMASKPLLAPQSGVAASP